MLDALLATRLVFILGITNLLLVSSIFVSCRCILGSAAGARLMKMGWYASLSRHHCHLWYLLGVSMTLHIIIAVYLLGFPF